MSEKIKTGDTEINWRKIMKTTNPEKVKQWLQSQKPTPSISFIDYMGLDFVGIEKNEEYIEMAKKRIKQLNEIIKEERK